MKSLQLSTKNICLPLILFLPVMLNVSDSITYNIAISDVFLPFIALILLTHLVKINHKNNLKFNRNMDYSIMYVLIICAVLVFSLVKISFVYDTESIFDGIKSTIKILINVAYFCVFIYCFKISKEKFQRIFLKAWSLVSVIISILGILGTFLFTIGINNPWSFSFRAIGTFNDPNLFATYIFISIGFSAIYNYKNRSTIKGWNIYINLIALLLTASRAAVITLILSIFFILIFLILNGELKKSKMIIKNIVVGILILSAIFYFIYKIYNINILLEGGNRLLNMKSSIKGDSRILQWICAIKIWLENPIFGAGIGKFMDVGISQGFTTYKILAHNTYLTFLSELGIVGLISYIWFPIMLLLKLIKNSMNNIENQVLIFTIVSVAICCISLNLENFRCIWIFWAYCFYYETSSKELTLPLITN